jgi:hypothetical protein
LHFILERPEQYEFSDIDMTPKRRVPVDKDYFTLMEFSAKWDQFKHALSKSHTISQRIYGTNDRF